MPTGDIPPVRPDSSITASRNRFWGRLAVVAAAVLWSTSGAFVKTLGLSDVTLSVYRAGCAGGVLLAAMPFLRVRPSWDVRMLGMMACFALMNYWYMASMTRTTAANAILLQYSAPLWMFAAGVLFLREPFQWRTLPALLVGMLGIGVLLAGEWSPSSGLAAGVGYGLLSGVGYASVAVFLRALGRHHPVWLGALNQTTAALAAAACFALDSRTAAQVWPPPNPSTLVAVAIFGAVQFALPYVLFAWGMRHVAAQEAGVWTLLEPLLLPIWAYLVAGEAPGKFTLLGGGILLAALTCQMGLAAAENRKSAGDGRP